MIYKTNVALAVRGSRVERGEEVELSDAEVASIDPTDIELVVDAPVETPEEDAPVAVEDMTGPQLKDRAKELGLATTGSKADLLERISLHLAGAPEEDAPSA